MLVNDVKMIVNYLVKLARVKRGVVKHLTCISQNYSKQQLIYCVAYNISNASLFDDERYDHRKFLPHSVRIQYEGIYCRKLSYKHKLR